MLVGSAAVAQFTRRAGLQCAICVPRHVASSIAKAGAKMGTDIRPSLDNLDSTVVLERVGSARRLVMNFWSWFWHLLGGLPWGVVGAVFAGVMLVVMGIMELAWRLFRGVSAFADARQAVRENGKRFVFD